LGENKIEREREPIIFSYDRGPLNSVIILRKRHNISERYYFGTRKHFEVEYGGREGGCDWVGCDFFCVPGLFKMPGTPKKIAGLITHYFGGNRTPKLGNSDFETTSKQGLT